jgi:acetolactate synthase-1/2/3 large subunit
VGAAIAAALVDAGVDAAFGMDDPQGLWSALRTSPIRTMVLHDERSAGFAASGYALAARRLCLCTGITGPGGMNLATPMLEAKQASIPVLFMIGEANPARADLHGFQTAPHEQVLSPLAKALVRLGRGEDVAAAVHRCVALATGGRPGPVLLLTGDDLLWEHMPVRPQGDGPSPYSRARLAPGGPAASRTELEAIHSSLLSARRPVIVAGGGVLLGEASEQLRAVAEKYRVPVAMTVLGKGAIPDRHELCLGVASAYTGGLHGLGAMANRCLQQADMVMVVGSDLDPLTASGGWPADGAELIRIDIDPAELSTHPGRLVQGDAGTVLRQLAEEAPPARSGGERERWLGEVIAAVGAHRERIDRLDRSERAPGYVWPGAAMRVLSEALGERDAIVTDASFSSSWCIDRIQQRRAGRRLFGPRGSGVLGWGLPAALGVKFQRPHAQVTCVTGDGGLHFSLGEMETALRMGLPLTLVVLNNRSLGFQRQSDRLHEGRDYADLCFDDRVDYVEVARGFGWEAVRAETEGELADAYRQARAGEEPTLIEVPTDPEVWAPITKFDGLLTRPLAGRGNQMAAVMALEREGDG